MQYRPFSALGLVVLATLALSISSAHAQTTAVGPYYATPSWDQKLPAATRFVILSNWSNAAVLDRETGLVWERQHSEKIFVWRDAVDHCVANKTGERMGWRLASVEELLSLADPTTANGLGQPVLSLPVGNPFVSSVNSQQLTIFWSNETVLEFPSTAMVVAMGGFFPPALDVPKGFSSGLDLHAWCVRSPR